MVGTLDYKLLWYPMYIYVTLFLGYFNLLPYARVGHGRLSPSLWDLDTSKVSS